MGCPGITDCYTLFTRAMVAESDRGTITGPVTGPASAVVPGGAVIAGNSDTAAQYQTVTTATGNYTLASLPAGVYDVSGEANGFKKMTQRGVTVQVAQTARIDFTVQVGAISASVTVHADAPLLNTELAEQRT